MADAPASGAGVRKGVGVQVPPVFIAKEGADLVYVVVGTLISMGIPFNEVFAALQNSNMSKVGPDGQVTKREDGKILKGESFQPAEEQIKEILK